MSCGCEGNAFDGFIGTNNPCAIPSNNFEESIASSLDNLVLNLFGLVTKTIVNGRATWTIPCALTNAILNHPQNVGEGFICYILRLMATMGFFWKNVWNAGTQYGKGDVVLYGANNDTLYVCILQPPIGDAPTDLTYWNLFLHAPAGLTGPVGPQGAPGSPGSSSNPTYGFTTVTTTYTATNTDAVIFLEAASGAFNVTLPLMSGLSAGKYFIFRTNGASPVTLLPTGSDTINSSGSYTLSLANESIQLVSKNSGNWFII
jgi:hypothetical protein